MPHIQTIRSVEEFESLRDPWNDLARRQPQVTPSLRNEWIASWMRIFGDRFSPLIIAAWDGSRLVGGAALSLSPRPARPAADLLRTAPGRRVRGSRHLHGLSLDPGQDPSALEAMLDAVCRCGWTRLRLGYVRPESRCLEWFRGHAPGRGFLLDGGHPVECPVLHLPGDMPALEAGMDPFFRKLLHSRTSRPREETRGRLPV
jgi:hypothetical protein